MELISKKVLWEKVAELEEMARDRYLASPNCLPNGGVNPSAVRYGAQTDERTAFKHMIADAPTIDAVPVVRCKDCKWYGRADKRRFYRGMDCLQKRISTIVPDKDYCSRAERREE